MKRFPLQRQPHSRPRFVTGHVRCTRCGLPACIRLGVGGPCYCSACAVRCVRLRRSKAGHGRTPASTRASSSA